jgi:hypothetical protein
MIRILKAASLLVALSAGCAAQDALALLKRSGEAQRANAEKAAQYTYIEETSHFEYDKSGARKLTSTETHEVLTLEGESYKKLTARNGKPLSVREAANEEKKLKQTAAERRKNRNGLFHHSFSFGWSEEP